MSADIESTVLEVPQPIASTVVSVAQEIVSTVVNIGGSGSNSQTAFSANAGESISAQTACALVNGLLYEADPTNPTHALCPIVISTQSGLTGAAIEYQTTGEVTGGSFVQGSRYHVGLNGGLRTTARAIGATWFKYIGVAKDTSTLTLDFGPSVAIA